MADEKQLIADRQKKADELRSLGVNPYANGFVVEHDIGPIVSRFGAHAPEGTNVELEKGAEPAFLAPDRFTIAGRIMAIRGFGKMSFVKLADRTGDVQVWLRKDKVSDAQWEVFKRAERGDFLGVTGAMTYTKTGELTLLAEQCTLLTKAIRALPEKFHGLSDQEIRYRQRYVDLIVNPDVREVFRKRSRIVRLLREFFDARDFMEVETPLLHSILGGAAARPFSTHHNALDLNLFMRIAPELFLKRLVVGGFERVYEIGRNFRNEGLSRKHNPEFTMLEFYQAHATFEDLMALTEELFAHLAREICGTEKISYEGQPVDLTAPWPRIPMKDLIVSASEKGIIPAGLERSTLESDAALTAWIAASGVGERKDELGAVLRKSGNHGERIGALFDYAGELALPLDRPVFVYDYPAETSPLSRRNEADPTRVDRFELFIVGREYANAFSELNDPVDQRERFAAQVAAKDRGAEETMDYDEDYCRALEYGMPPTAGQGIGIDRLVMLLCDQPSIRDVILFPLMRPE